MEQENKKEEQREIANTIAQQLGNRCFVMIGAKNLLIMDEQDGGLQFQIGKNPKGVQTVQVIYNRGKDEYTMRFWKMNRKTYEAIKLAEVDGLYFDMLHRCIEYRTGLATSL